MMEETNADPTGEYITVELMVEFYLRHRPDPIQTLVAFLINKEHLEEGQELKRFMQIAAANFLSSLDTKGELRVVLSDARFNKQIIMLDEIQAVSILAPDDMERV